MFLFKVLAVAVVNFSFLFVFARGGASPNQPLLCKHISQIQQSYLSQHIKKNILNTKLQKRIIHDLLEVADPNKTIFLQKDIKIINNIFRNLLQDIAQANCSSLNTFFSLWKKRMKERAEFAKIFLSSKAFKINPNTSLSLDSKKRKRFQKKQKAEKYLSKYIQFQVTNLLSTMKLPKARKFVVRQYQRNIKLLSEKIKTEKFAIYLNAFAKALDPHSSYFSWKELEDFQIEMSRSLEGIGARLSFEDGFTVIAEVIEGGAVDRSGKLQAKDKILAVGQGDHDSFENIIEMDLSDVVRKIRGKKGSKVRLLISRKTKSGIKKFEITLVRDKIPLERAKVYYIDKKVSGKKMKLALIHLGSFYADWKNRAISATADLIKILKEVKRKGAHGVVLDLSNNGGGSLSDAVNISGLFFKTGGVVKQSKGGGAFSELKDRDPRVQFSGPLVVLVNRFSASASEIVSGALQDYKRAIIVGAGATYGKGTVQTVQPLGRRHFGALKITIGMFYTPSGKTTQHQGVTPDILFPVPSGLKDWGEASLDYSLKPDSVPRFVSKNAQGSLKQDKWKVITSSLVKVLKVKSKKRVRKSKEFQKFIKSNEKINKKNIKIADLLKEQKEAKKEKIKETTNTIALRKQKTKKYLDRADIQESLNILADVIIQQK
ncbi:MAG: PDZ domain-containing protein [Bdellovibrionaceae bacterium]|nr:PDZ domain-containing protein [Pseudobdellovibrionaceae bacterium]